MTILMDVTNGSEDPDVNDWTGTFTYHSPITDKIVCIPISCNSNGIKEVESFLKDLLFIGLDGGLDFKLDL